MAEEGADEGRVLLLYANPVNRPRGDWVAELGVRACQRIREVVLVVNK